MKRLSMLLAGVVLSACAATPRPSQDWGPRLSIGEQVRESIQIDDVRDTALSDDTLQVVVAGHSLASALLYLRYRTVWFDAVGMPIDTVVSRWNRTEVEKHRPFEWKMTAPSPNAAGYRVEIEQE